MMKIKLIGGAIVFTIFLIACGVIYFQSKRLDKQAQELGAVATQLEAQKEVTNQIILDAAEWQARTQALEGRQREVHTIHRETVREIETQDPVNPTVTVTDLGRRISESTAK